MGGDRRGTGRRPWQQNNSRGADSDSLFDEAERGSVVSQEHIHVARSSQLGLVRKRLLGERVAVDGRDSNRRWR